MSGIFISYRRDDSSGWAGRLHEYLVREWGPDNVFMDIDAIAPGEDFRDAIARTIRTCDVVLVVIGPNWANSRNQAGNRRLDDETDTHRAEVASALAADVRVVPVLVGGAAMPQLADLPEPLKVLAYRNAAIIEDRRFHSDAIALQHALKQFAETLAAKRAAEVEAAGRAEQEEVEAAGRAEQEEVEAAGRAEQEEVEAAGRAEQEEVEATRARWRLLVGPSRRRWRLLVGPSRRRWRLLVGPSRRRWRHPDQRGRSGSRRRPPSARDWRHLHHARIGREPRSPAIPARCA
jgi:TIR domain